MNKKYIQIAILFFLFAFALLEGAWVYSQYKKNIEVRGKYTFAATKEKINYLGNIKIITPDSGEVNIYRSSDGIWHFKEAKDYYVNEEMLAAFFNMVKTSLIVSTRQADDLFLRQNNLFDDKSTLIKTYDYDGKLLDEVVLGSPSREEGRTWARKASILDSVYLISSAEGFSGAAQDWIPYPLLSIKTAEIKEVIINGKKVEHREFEKFLKHSISWRNFAAALSFLDYYGLTFKSDLAELPPDVKVRQIDVTMLNGMIYKLTLLSLPDAYWIVISMSAQKIFSVEAAAVAADTYRYYSDWVFRLSDEQGQALFDDTLLE